MTILLTPNTTDIPFLFNHLGTLRLDTATLWFKTTICNSLCQKHCCPVLRQPNRSYEDVILLTPDKKSVGCNDHTPNTKGKFELLRRKIQ